MRRFFRPQVAIATYLPAGDSAAYAEPQAYWSNQPIFKTIVEYSKLTPANNTSPYYYDGRNAIGTQIQNIMNGADIVPQLLCTG